MGKARVNPYITKEECLNAAKEKIEKLTAGKTAIVNEKNNEIKALYSKFMLRSAQSITQVILDNNVNINNISRDTSVTVVFGIQGQERFGSKTPETYKTTLRAIFNVVSEGKILISLQAFNILQGYRKILKKNENEIFKRNLKEEIDSNYANTPAAKVVINKNEEKSTEKKIVSNIKYEKDPFLYQKRKWVISFNDGSEVVTRDILRYFLKNQFKIIIPDYYDSFFINFAKALELNIENIRRNPSEYIRKTIYELDDNKMKEAFSIFSIGQTLGKIPKVNNNLEAIDFSDNESGVAAVFYDKTGKLMGFELKDAVEYKKDDILDKANKKSSKFEIEYYLVRKGRKFFVISKNKIKPADKIEKALSKNFIRDLATREEELKRQEEQYRLTAKTFDYEFGKFKVYDEDGNVIKQKHVLKFYNQNTDKKIDVKDEVYKEFSAPLLISTGKVSHHKRIDEMTLRQKRLARDLKVEMAMEERKQNIEKKLNEMQSKVNRYIAEYSSTLNIGTVKKYARSNIRYKHNISKVTIKRAKKNIVDVNQIESFYYKEFPELEAPQNGVYMTTTSPTELFNPMKSNELQSLLNRAIELQQLDEITLREAFSKAAGEVRGKILHTRPVFFYNVNLPIPRIASKYKSDIAYGCIYAAIKFFMYVTNTPKDEDYEYWVTIPAHEERKKKRARYKTKSGKLRPEEEVLAEMQETVMVPERKVKRKHFKDEHYVRGDWMMTFRGCIVKAFNTEAEPGSSSVTYDYQFSEEDFELDNSFITLEGALERESKILKIANKLMELTEDAGYEPELDKNGIPVYNSESFSCPCTNVNPRWAQLEFGWYKYKDSDPSERTGIDGAPLKYKHGLKSGYSYQAPKGFIGVTNFMLEKLTTNKNGSSKVASTLINRFVSTYRSTKNFERYYSRYIEPIMFDVSKPPANLSISKYLDENNSIEVKI